MSTQESALDICLPELCSLLDQWRMATVPVAMQGGPPHMTLLYPWRAAPLQGADRPEAAAAAAAAAAGTGVTGVTGVASFQVTCRRIARFPGVLACAAAPADVLRALRGRLARIS